MAEFDLSGAGRKAEVLEVLRPLLEKARVLPSLTVRRAEWRHDPDAALDLVEALGWEGALIVRSSASIEDSATSSAAGRFHTEEHVLGRTHLCLAVNRVFASYDRAGLEGENEHVLLQPMVVDVVACGVAAARDHVTGGPYRVISWSTSGSTDDVTSGRMSDVRTWYEALSVRPTRVPSEVVGVLDILDELELMVGRDFEIEFAMSPTWGPVLFQLRSLTRMGHAAPDPASLLTPVASRVTEVFGKAAAGTTASPVPGGPTVLGVMPDWNPAEIIGTHPRRSAISLYRTLVTDRTWAEARAAYGYRDVGNTPILVDLGGLPYVDVRASAASLIPAALSLDTTARLVDHYVRRLAEAPYLHDKFEFEVVLSAWLPGADRWVRRHLNGVLDESEQAAFGTALRELTDDLVAGSRPWTRDLDVLARLDEGLAAAAQEPVGSAQRIGLLLDSTRRHGTLPFAGLARGAFVATHILYRAVAEGAVASAARDRFLSSASMVTTEFVQDLATLGVDELLGRYGHLRPGTYDLLSPRYDERPSQYLGGHRGPDSELRGAAVQHPEQVELHGLGAALAECGLSFGEADFREFALRVVRGREMAKLRFTRNLSEAMVEMIRWGQQHGLSRDDVSYLTVDAVLADHDGRTLRALVADGRAEHARAAHIVLPPMLSDVASLWSFEMPSTEPNFITGHRVVAEVADLAAGQDPSGRIVFIPSADPGYDWIFARGICGLVTAYGGINSHMAIRAREFDLPSAIGVGETRYLAWSAAREVDLDAGARIVRVVR